MSRLYRLRWWLARRIAPKNVVALRVLEPGPWNNTLSVTLYGSPLHVWGYAKRLVNPALLDELQEHHS